MAEAVSALLNYLIAGVQDRGGRPIKTQLVKLAYLVDLEYYRRVGKTATGLAWVFFHYGPYTSELEPILSDLPDVDEEGFTSSKGRKGSVYRSDKDTSEASEMLRAHFPPLVKQMADRVLNDWALADLWQLLDYVYFETEPMQDAKRGQPLDFGTVVSARDMPPVKPREVVFLKSVEAAYNKRLTAPGTLDQATVERLTAMRKRRTPPVRTPPTPSPAPYDEDYFNALRIMEED